MMDQISNLSFSLNPEATASAHDDGIVILHTGKGRVFSSNKTGALIWLALQQRRSLETVVEEISNEFQIAATTARLHTLDFLGALERQALIEREVVS
jgi:Coenzyme PQQ synthesis protein D (PqqD)